MPLDSSRSNWGTIRSAARRLWGTAGPAVVILVAQLAVFRVNPLEVPGLYLYGIVLGLMAALMAIGMALIHRANGILNFAQGEMGLLPTVLALSLISYSGLPYLVGLALGLTSAVVLGGLLELLVIRRFERSSRLILTVATIGLAQLLVVAAAVAPRMWHREPMSQAPVEPFALTFELDPLVFGANHLLALLVAPILLVGVVVFLRRTDTGIAVRAAADRRDRASLLGVPVKRLNNVVWCVAAALSFAGMFLRAGVVGVPMGTDGGFGATGFTALLAALAALTLGRFSNLGAVALSAVALGVVEQVVVWSNGDDPALVYPVLAVVILVSLVFQVPGRSRAGQDPASAWPLSDDVRRLPAALESRVRVQLAKWGSLGAIALLAWALPAVGFMDSARLLLAATVVVFAIVGVSIVMLTGWAGQVSLGQMGFVGVGAAVGAVATSQWGLDLTLAMPVAGLAGAAVATVVGLPALRLRGLLLAVTTLAFTITASSYLLNPRYFSWIPKGRIERPALLGAIDLSSQASVYRLCVVVLALVVAGLTGIRRSRSGRAMLAIRDNERAAQSFGLSVVRTKLAAFAISGAIAAVAGCLLVHVTQRFDPGAFGASESFTVFSAAVVGGLGSLAGGVLGALFSRGGVWFLEGYWRLLPSAAGSLVVLMAFPSGLSGALYRLRDRWLQPALLHDDAGTPGRSATSASGDQGAAIPAGVRSALPATQGSLGS